ncbi:MAG: glycoside hydrolase family 43 protein [Kiritimatiellia bacterium]
MRNLLLFAAAVCAVLSAAADSKIRAVYTVPGELDDIVGHVQGAACSTQGVYLSHAGGIYKIGWDGRLIRKCAAPVHLGDVGYANGRLYGALALREPIDGKKGMIRVWDEDLNVVGEHLLSGAIDGCAVIGETIYYGLDLYGKPPHRRCRIGRLSLDFKELGEVETDHGGQCHYGVQTMATDGARLFCGYYSFGAPPVTCAWFTPDLRACGGTPHLRCAEGFGMVPKSLFPSEYPRFFTVNALGGNCHKWHSITNPAQIRLDFHEFRDGRFLDVTERVPPPLLTRNDILASDPFIYTDTAARLYRLYLLTRETDGFGAGVQMRTSRDLRTWSPAKQVLRVPARRKCVAVWAPEMHAYRGAYYMFATVSTRPGAFPELPVLEPGDWPKIARPKRGTWIYRAESPEGPFREWSAESIPPPEWSTLDGTFWVEDGTPYMVFCHEWTQVRDGRMMAVALTDDLRAAAGKPFELFRASSRPDAEAGPEKIHVTDGPYLYRSHNGSLLMIWSSSCKTGYCVYVTRSASGKLAGPWGAHERIFDLDGGHGMLFRTLHGQLMMCLHQPNHPEDRKRMRVFAVHDLGDTLRIAD